LKFPFTEKWQPAKIIAEASGGQPAALLPFPPLNLPL